MHKFTISHLIFIFFLIATAVFAIIAYRIVLQNLPEFVPLFIFWVISLVKMLYDTSSTVYLACNRYVAWLINMSTNLEFAIQYELSPEQESAIDMAIDSIFTLFPNAKIWQDGTTQKIVHVSGFTVRIKLLHDFSTDNSELLTTNLHIDLTEMVIPYRRIENTLAKKMGPLFEKLSLSIRAEWTKYTARVRYDGASPFFGLYVKKLPPHQVSKFHCELFEIVGDETDNVTIGKEETIINTTSIANLLSLSKKYLSLSSSSPS